MKKIFGSLILVTLFSGCGEHEHSANGIAVTKMEQILETGEKEVYFLRTDNQQGEGRLRRFSPDGNLLEEADYHNGLLHGNRVLYRENGDTLILETHRNGLFEGPYVLYHETGGPKFKGNYTNNKMEGIWRQYYPDGSLREEVTFADNLENGPFREYFPNGQLEWEGAYLQGDNEHGPLRQYNEQGELIKEMTCDRGMCRTTWKKEN